MTPNARIAKLCNKRIAAARNSDGTVDLLFSIFSDDQNPRAVHWVERGRIVRTGLKLSPEAAQALWAVLGEVITNQPKTT